MTATQCFLVVVALRVVTTAATPAGACQHPGIEESVRPSIHQSIHPSRSPRCLLQTSFAKESSDVSAGGFTPRTGQAVRSLGTNASHFQDEDAKHGMWSKAVEDKWIFLHVGKNGGGTVVRRAEDLELGLLQSHPFPLPDLIENFSKVLIAARDPIDHFASAFNWESQALCTEEDVLPFGRVHGGDWFSFPDRFCKEDRANSHLLNIKYQRNVNTLAEALCSSSEKIRQEAAADVKRIPHANNSLADWMQIAKVKAKKQVLAVVLEPGIDFETQVDAGFAWILKEGGWDVRPDQLPASTTDDSSLHSSSNKSFPALTEAATGCLAHYLIEDYDVLEWLKAHACHGTESHTCEAALQSILDRRAALRQAVQ